MENYQLWQSTLPSTVVQNQSMVLFLANIFFSAYGTVQALWRWMQWPVIANPTKKSMSTRSTRKLHHIFHQLDIKYVAKFLDIKINIPNRVSAVANCREVLERYFQWLYRPRCRMWQWEIFESEFQYIYHSLRQVRALNCAPKDPPLVLLWTDISA